MVAHERPPDNGHAAVPAPTPCPHARQETRRRTHKNGATHVAVQCLECGQQVGNPVPKSRWLGRLSPARLPAWDDTLTRQYFERRHQEWLRQYEEHRAQKSAAWWAWYDD